MLFPQVLVWDGGSITYLCCVQENLWWPAVGCCLWGTVDPESEAFRGCPIIVPGNPSLGCSLTPSDLYQLVHQGRSHPEPCIALLMALGWLALWPGPTLRCGSSSQSLSPACRGPCSVTLGLLWPHWYSQDLKCGLRPSAWSREPPNCPHRLWYTP